MEQVSESKAPDELELHVRKQQVLGQLRRDQVLSEITGRLRWQFAHDA